MGCRSVDHALGVTAYVLSVMKLITIVAHGTKNGAAEMPRFDTNILHARDVNKR